MQFAVFDLLIDSARSRAAKLGRVFGRDHRHDSLAVVTPGFDWTPGGTDDRKGLRLNSDNGSLG
jgi:hypothetical protein